MRSTHKILSLLLALLLTLSNMAFSTHVSSHSATESGLCSLCVHPGGPDTAITHEPGKFFVTSIEFNLTLCHTPTHVLPVILHVHQSRAPPSLT